MDAEVLGAKIDKTRVGRLKRDKWDRRWEDTLFDILLARVSQNPRLEQLLEWTYPRRLVYVDGSNYIFGCGRCTRYYYSPQSLSQTVRRFRNIPHLRRHTHAEKLARPQPARRGPGTTQGTVAPGEQEDPPAAVRFADRTLSG